MRLFLLCFMLFVSAIVLAAPKKDPKEEKANAARAQAEALYQKAEENFKLQKYEDALQGFIEAYQLVNESALLFNIAQCQRFLGRLEEAKRSYQTFLRDQPKSLLRANAETRIAELDEEIKRLASKGNIFISSTQEVEVYFDGDAKGPAPLALKQIEPGEHQITIKKAGFVDLKQTITVQPAQTLDFKAPMLVPLVEEGVSTSKLLLFGSAGLGGASALSLGASAFFLFSASALRADTTIENVGSPNLDVVDFTAKAKDLEIKEARFKAFGIASAGFFAGAVITTGVRVALNKKNAKKEAAENPQEDVAGGKP